MCMELLIFRCGIVNLRSTEISVKFAIFHCDVTSFLVIRVPLPPYVCVCVCVCVMLCVSMLFRGTSFSCMIHRTATDNFDIVYFIFNSKQCLSSNLIMR